MTLQNPHVHRRSLFNSVYPFYTPCRKVTSSSNSSGLLLNLSNTRARKRVDIGCVSPRVRAHVIMARSSNTKLSRSVKAVVTVKQSSGGGLLTNLVSGIVGKHMVLELVSDELDPSKLFISLCFYILFFDKIFDPSKLFVMLPLTRQTYPHPCSPIGSPPSYWEKDSQKH